MNTFLATVAIFFMPFYLACIRTVSTGIFSANASKLIVIYHIAPIVFGIVGIGFFNFELWMGLEEHLTDSMRVFVAIQSIIAIYLMFFFIWLLRDKFKQLDRIPATQIRKVHWSKIQKLPLFLVIVTLLLYALELARLPVIPIIVAIAEGPFAGALARGAVINYQINNGLPGFGYILYFVPMISLIWLYTQYVEGKIKFLFLFYAALYLGFNVIFLSKSAFIAPGVMLMWVRYTDRNIVFDYKIIATVFMLIIFMFTFSGIESIGELLTRAIRRAFVGQVEGMFLIREFYPTSDIAALLYGFPGKGVFGLQTFDPSVDIISKVFGGDIDGFVNMNSFFIGQGFVMLGNLIVILGPLAYAFNIWVIFILGPIFRRSSNAGLMRIIQFFFILTLSINTNFALLLFIRPIVGFLIVSSFFELVCVLSKAYKRSPRAKQKFPIVPQTI
jgi:hypothetical protein